MAEEKKNTKERKPSALKRDLQSEKRRLKNKTYKSTVTSLIKSFQSSLAQNDAAATKANLSKVCSLMDKGVKKGIYPKNKANRVKSNLSRKVSA
jgi:small subunit ribosomal protein S20